MLQPTNPERLDNEEISEILAEISAARNSLEWGNRRDFVGEPGVDAVRT